MANRNWPNSRIYTQHVMPCQLDARISIGSAGAPTIISAKGITSISRLAAGIYQMQLNDNYNGIFKLTGSFESPFPAPSVTAGSFVTGTAYIIVTVGTTNFNAIGLPAGVTAAVGSAFVATGAGSGTGTARAAASTTATGSGISSVEQIGPLQNHQPSNDNQGAFLMFQTLPGSGAAGSTPPNPNLSATLAGFAVLGSTAVTNTGSSVIGGDVGISPAGAITGFPPGVTTGTTHNGDATAATARTDLQTAITAFNAMTTTETFAPAVVIGDGGTRPVLGPGVYEWATAGDLTGTVTLNAGGDPDALFVFLMGTTLTTATASAVILAGGAQADNVYWVVGSSATLGTGTQLQGSVLAVTSITLVTGASTTGRLLAHGGAVTLDSNSATLSEQEPSAAGPAVATDPAAGSVMQIQMLINNSSLQ